MDRNLLKDYSEEALLSVLSLSSESSEEQADPGFAEAAESELIRRYHSLIASLTRRYTLWSWDQQDFEQVGTIGFLKAVRSFRNEMSVPFRNYASLLISREIYGVLEKNLRKKDIPLGVLVSFEDSSENSNDSSFPVESSLSVVDNAPTPEDEYVRKAELEEFIRHLEDKLSASEKEIFHHYIHGLSVAEISSAAEMSEKSVRNALTRVKRKAAALRNR